MSRARSFKECEKTGLLKIQTAEEADEQEDDRHYDKCPEPVVIKECEKTRFLKKSRPLCQVNSSLHYRKSRLLKKSRFGASFNTEPGLFLNGKNFLPKVEKKTSTTIGTRKNDI